MAREFGTDHHQIRVEPERLLPALPRAIAAMSEPMVSHDAVAFFLLSEEVAKLRKVVQSGQGADEVFAGYYWYPPLLEADGDGLEVYAASVLRPRPRAACGRCVGRAPLDGDPSRAFAADWFSPPGAATAIDRGLRLDAEVMLVDDPVKRVDNMTMAHGLEARTPFLDHELVELAAACPPELKLADGGKGVLKRAARGIVPDAVIDRPKGYFPVPALSHLEGPVLELVGDALRSGAARSRGLFRDDVVEDDARVAQRAPHEPRRVDAVAARPARAVAADARGLMRRSPEEIAAILRAKERIDRLDLYPAPVRIGHVRVLVTPWLFRIPGFRRFHGYELGTLILLKMPLADASDDLIVHELCHVWQHQHKPVGMWLSYLYRGYRNNPHEIEARAAAALTREPGGPVGPAEREAGLAAAVRP